MIIYPILVPSTLEPEYSEHLRGLDNALPDTEIDYYRRWLATQLAWRDREIARLKEALGKINAVRNSIIGLQTFNWSEHGYPLVAALDGAGIEGAPYPESRENFGTMVERTVLAESERDAALARVAELETAARELITMIDMEEQEEAYQQDGNVSGMLSDWRTHLTAALGAK